MVLPVHLSRFRRRHGWSRPILRQIGTSARKCHFTQWKIRLPLPDELSGRRMEWYVGGMLYKIDQDAFENGIGCARPCWYLSTRLLDVIIPRLLRPLETEGRRVRPALCHGDLWYGNACTDLSTVEPMIFDGKALYAHNEYELGDCYAARNRFGRNYFRAYQAHNPHSLPEQDFKGRNILSSL